MRIPSGKGWYARGESVADDIAFARAIGCTFIALPLSRATREELDRNGAPAGLMTFLYDTPEGFRPGTWRSTLAGMAYDALERGLAGIIVDPEDAPLWVRAPAAEVAAFVGELREARLSGLSVGVTSFPTWPHAAALGSSGAWGSPQMYLLRGASAPVSPGDAVSGREQMTATMRRYLGLWRESYVDLVPSLAAWDRSVEQEREYLAAVPHVRGALFWNTQVPRELEGVLRDYVPRPFPSGPSC